ncbi:MAG: methionyl-tRNA synthetase, methionyl-tRNA synthetase [Candidatus Kaiserbacteria bacterium]|nr:methionyl-tRNA synthetase, methionyl-tRNA synthetase [Candidatus Kaiserbacteria bacterium]
MKPLYITTTLPYVNSDPHIGFALEIVHADIIARYRRLMGGKVFFNTGTDEHGQKIAQKAASEGRDVKEYVDHYAAEFRKLKEALDLSNDAFIRTTDDDHVRAAQELWRICAAKGDIYKKKYKGLYCVGDEAFIKESDLVNGKCPNHPTMEPVEVEEENYFFMLSNYQDRILEYLKQPGVIVPEWRREEAVKFVEQGLEDFSISRETKRMSWGVPVPGDEHQVMYVWFDALTNYISTLGWPGTEGNFKTFWTEGETLQLAGKDQVRFQSIMWQGMLMSAGIKATDKVIYHGFITSGGQKMSKSLGNVIEPYAIVNEYGADALRYFLARHVHPFDDSDVTMEKFKESYNADLANGLGNVTARIMKLAETHLESPIARPEAVGFPQEYTEALEKYDYNKVLDFVWGEIQKLDQKITTTEPFKLIKTDVAQGRALIAELATELYKIVRLLNPFMPQTNEKIKAAILANKKPENLFPRKE